MIERSRQYYPVTFENSIPQEDATIASADFEAASAVFEQHKMAERNQVTALFPEPLDPDRTERIRGFFSKLGLSTGPAIKMPPCPSWEQAQALAPITDDIFEFQSDGLLGSLQPVAGAYHPLHDIALLYSYRDPKRALLARNHETDITTEIALAHELGHSAGASEFLLEVNPSDIARSECIESRSGFHTLERKEPFNRGVLLTEALVHMLAHAYRAVHRPDHSAGNVSFGDLIIPAKYTYSDETFTDGCKPDGPVLAALGLELILARDPTLFGPLLTAYKHPGHLPEVVGRMNELSPNLYQNLNLLQNNPRHFLQGLSTVLDTLHRSNPRAILTADRTVQDIIQHHLQKPDPLD